MDIIVNTVVYKDNKVLMVQENWGKFVGMWNFPAGHLDEFENIFIGAIREAKEETGYDVCLTGFLGLQNVFYPNKHVILLNFLAEIVGGEIEFDKDEIMNVEFVELDKLLNMSDSELRGGNARKEMIKRARDKKFLPLDAISNFDFRN